MTDTTFTIEAIGHEPRDHVVATVSVWDAETDDFIGDFTVTYQHRGGGRFVASDGDTRAAGGIYADHADPSFGLLMGVTETVNDMTAGYTVDFVETDPR